MQKYSYFSSNILEIALSCMIHQTKSFPDYFLGSVAAIVVGVVAIVLILLVGAYYFKIRHSSYGRLLDDSEHSSVGNFLNPMFDG
uniref:Uncharacterized protein n=1 Tax=Sinocyclocheilus grahami TaxID=75366 RepID=A0A672RS03_SINGR